MSASNDNRQLSSIQLLSLLLTCGLFSQLSVAADSGPATEEIVVEGSRDRINLKLQVDRAEDEFYAILNDLLEDPDQRVECRYERVIGSNIKERVCQTGYMRKELSTAGTLSLYGVDYMASGKLMEKNRQLRERTIDLLKNNAKLRNAAVNLSQRVEEYQDEYGIQDNPK